MPRLEDELQAFFEEYASLFHADMTALCDRFNYPSITQRLDGSVALFSRKEEAVRFFTVARDRFEGEGCTAWAIRRLAAEQLGAGAAFATIDWRMLRADGSPIRGWTQTYNVIGGSGRWKVVLSTLHAGSEC